MTGRASPLKRFIIVCVLAILAPGPIASALAGAEPNKQAMSEDVAELPPIYGVAELKLDTSRLKPHRLLYDPLEGVGGFDDGLFTDGTYKKPQISITMNRTVYYDADDVARDAIRVRWVANTHPHVDEILVDAKTLGTVNERTRAGRNWQTRDEIIYVRDGAARVTTLSDESEPVLHVFPLSYPQHYGLMVFPYLFASMDVPVGARFRLPAIGSGSESFVEIKVVGPSSFINANNETQEALLVTSKHSWGEIDWYVDGENPPYHLHAVWRFKSGDTSEISAVSRVIDWVEFKSDIYENVVDPDALRKKEK